MAKKYQWMFSAWTEKRRGKLFEWLHSNGKLLSVVVTVGSEVRGGSK